MLLLVAILAGASSAAGAIKITMIRFDPPGRDTGSNASLNAEWIRIKNTGARARQLKGWTIRDRENHVYRFPSFTLRPGKSVTLHTGRGSSGAAHRYWGQKNYVWNNDGDAARLRNAKGSLVDRCAYRGSGSSVRC